MVPKSEINKNCCFLNTDDCSMIDENQSKLDFEAIRYHFYTSEHIKEVIMKIHPEEYDNEIAEYRNALKFFNKHKSEVNFVYKLESVLKEYGDVPVLK